MEAIIKDINLYYVGGVVRDELIGTPSFDMDLCYEGNAIEFSKNLNKIKVNPEFGTVRVLLDNKEIDIASTRIETYPKSGHLPVVYKIGCSLKEDLFRRDFTINAMAKNTVTGKLVDFFNGLDDIKNKKIRVLHKKSFIDDPSRIIRALKFCIRFGFELEEETERLQYEYLNNINYDLSFHRLKKELKETFNLNNDEAFEIFVNKGIYKLLGENQKVPKITCSISELVKKYAPNSTWLVYLGAFDLSNFELTNEEMGIIKSYNEIKDRDAYSDFEAFQLFKNCPLESILLYAVTVDFNIVTRYLDYVSKIKLNINGNDLIDIGIKQGKVFQEIFDYVFEKKLCYGEVDKNQELEWVKEKFLL